MEETVKGKWKYIIFGITLFGTIIGIVANSFDISGHFENQSISNSDSINKFNSGKVVVDTEFHRKTIPSPDVYKPVWFQPYKYMIFSQDGYFSIIQQQKLFVLIRDTLFRIPISYIQEFKIRSFEQRLIIIYKNQIASNSFSYTKDFSLSTFQFYINELNLSGYKISIKYAGLSTLMIVTLFLAVFTFLIPFVFFKDEDSMGCSFWLLLISTFVCFSIVRCS